MYPVMERIVEHYRKGTRFGDPHGQRRTDHGGRRAGSGHVDGCPGGRDPSYAPHGKPVEVNAYWYNALRIMAAFAERIGEDGAEYVKLAEKVKISFTEAFWMEEEHCLKDVISGTEADTQIRCNQIWAVSMPFTMLDEEKERQVVDTVFEKLYTPYGLRTLSQEDGAVLPCLRRRGAEEGSGIPSGNGVGVSSGGVLSRISEGEQREQCGEGRGLCADGSAGECPAGGLHRSAPGDLRRGKSRVIEGMLCAGLECG